jgi:hypothetical protein
VEVNQIAIEKAGRWHPLDEQVQGIGNDLAKAAEKIARCGLAHHARSLTRVSS